MFEGSRLGIQVSRDIVMRHTLFLFTFFHIVGQEPSVFRVAHR